jgi:hypothetical protein
MHFRSGLDENLVDKNKREMRSGGGEVDKL